MIISFFSLLYESTHQWAIKKKVKLIRFEIVMKIYLVIRNKAETRTALIGIEIRHIEKNIRA